LIPSGSTIFNSPFPGLIDPSEHLRAVNETIIAFAILRTMAYDVEAARDLYESRLPMSMQGDPILAFLFCRFALREGFKDRCGEREMIEREMTRIR
jgi:hypothetical protein